MKALNHKSGIAIVVLITLLAIVGCQSAPKVQPTATPTEDPRTPVIIDTDMSVDAIMSILYLLQRPEFSVKAITVSGTGEVHCGPGTEHALGLIALAGAGEIPVACGRETPLAGDHKFPKDWRAQVDGPMGIDWPKGGAASNLTAAELLKETILKSPKRVVLVTDGPLTNIAEALQASPELAKNIQMIYSMGGAIDVPGNIFGVPLSAPNKTAEFNIFIDPHAANIVLNSDAPITLVPLDITNQAPMDKTFYKILSKHLLTPAAKTVYELLTSTQIYQQGAYFWDPLTYAISSDESLATFTTKKIAVIEEEGPEIGRTKVIQAGREVRVAVKTNPERFVEDYLSTINGGQKIIIDWAVAKAPPVATLRVTISAGKCTLEGSKQVPAGEIGFNLMDKDPVKGSALAIVTIDNGKTFDDLDAWQSENPPPWIQLLSFAEAGAGAEILLTAEVKEKPFYLVCFTGPPITKIGVLGPIEVVK